MFADSVTGLFSELELRLVRLDELTGVSREEYLGDHALQDRVERNLQVAIQCCLDLGSHLLARAGHPPPGSFPGIFLTLGRTGVIHPVLANSLADMASFRNVLVHGYLKVDPELVNAYLGELDQLREFARATAVALERD